MSALSSKNEAFLRTLAWPQEQSLEGVSLLSTPAGFDLRIGPQPELELAS